MSMTFIKGIIAGLLICLCSSQALTAQSLLKDSKDFLVPFEKVDSKVLARHVKKLDKNIRIVGLGEVSHYTKECYQLKQTLILELIKKGYDGLVMEVDFGQALLWNDYVTEGKGDLDQLVAESGWFTYRTEEFKSLLRQIRKHNLKSKKPFRVYGMEMTAMNHNLNWLDHYFTEHLPQATELLKQLKTERTIVAFQYHDKKEVLSYWDLFYALREALATYEEELKLKGGNQNYQIAQQIAEITRQYATFISHDDFGLKVEFRDQFSTRNVLWSMNQLGENSRIAIWAHNGHVVKKSVIFNYDILGYYLNQIFGEAYYAIGFTFNQGEFGAFSSDGFKRWKLKPVKSASWTKELNAQQTPFLLFDIRQNLEKLGKRTSGPLFEMHPIRRDIAESHREENALLMDIHLARSYDCLIYFEESNFPTTIPWAR